MASWVESVRLLTYGYGHSMREVAGSPLGRGTIVGGIFHPAKQLARFSPPNMPDILNLFIISLRGEAISYGKRTKPHRTKPHFKNTMIYVYFIL